MRICVLVGIAAVAVGLLGAVKHCCGRGGAAGRGEALPGPGGPPTTAPPGSARPAPVPGTPPANLGLTHGPSRPPLILKIGPL